MGVMTITPMLAAAEEKTLKLVANLQSTSFRKNGTLRDSMFDIALYIRDSVTDDRSNDDDDNNDDAECDGDEDGGYDCDNGSIDDDGNAATAIEDDDDTTEFPGTNRKHSAQRRFLLRHRQSTIQTKRVLHIIFFTPIEVKTANATLQSQTT